MGKRRRSSILQGVTDSIPIPSGTVNDAAILDDEVGEISGEFGDNTSITSRTARRVSIAPDASVETIPPELPPEDEPEVNWTEYLKFVKWHHMAALIWKNFLWMWKNIPVMTFIIGFVVACCCENERSATYMALGSFFPIVMLCGIIWPIEAMSPYLRWMSDFLPLTQATESLRCIIARGWGLDVTVVYTGFLSITLWILIFLSISILVLKFKKG